MLFRSPAASSALPCHHLLCCGNAARHGRRVAHTVDAVLPPCNVDTAGPLSSAQLRETIRSTPSCSPCSLTPSLNAHSSIEPEPRPKLPTRIADDSNLPIPIQAYQHLRRALLPLSAQGIAEGRPGSPSPSRSSSSPAADMRASSRWAQATFLRHFCAHVLPLPCSLS